MRPVASRDGEDRSLVEVARPDPANPLPANPIQSIPQQREKRIKLLLDFTRGSEMCIKSLRWWQSRQSTGVLFTIAKHNNKIYKQSKKTTTPVKSERGKKEAESGVQSQSERRWHKPARGRAAVIAV